MNFERMEEKHLSEMLMLWNKELAASFPMRLRLLQQNIVEDRNWLREGSWVVSDAETGRVIGFVVSKIAREESERFGIRPDMGWIQVLFVDPDTRRLGIGSDLLFRAEAALRNAGARRILLGNDLHSRLFPGVPDELTEAKRWFEKRAYLFSEQAHDLLNAYHEGEEVGLPDVAEATFRVAKPSDQEALTAFMHRCFPGTWDYQHRDYWKRGGTGREFVLLEREGAIIGFCRINDAQSPLLAQNIYWSALFQDELGGIGPLGIDESFRGYKYGISIVQAAVHYLLERGIRRMVIDTTPFIAFYGKLGYTRWKSYAKYEKYID
ncbi:hypothetical protein A8709_21420 [Paenibacillus pectinilyticus]|uniref:N-acetyltransferase domain-containing protein n=1 Tax=Paenibacillus pectinilyticus TaxID=512399 RepID=A0A1C0ZXQ9_9BACL|nr:GNAT family N-acetyltransferase [Paenibacillus pectinilyticus]OCT12893.1 hypothetical protein A8709_21420 [Paenibacillus pectinilyticus]